MPSDRSGDETDQLVMSASAVESATRTARVCTRCVHIKHKFSDGYVNETYPYVGFWERFMLSLETRWRLIKKAHREEIDWYAEDDATGQTRLVTDGGRTDDDLTDRWEEKAEENVEEWGEQSIETLLLATQEELGELTQATLEYRAEGGDYARIFEEIDDLGALLCQFHDAANAHRFNEVSESDD